MLTLYTKNGCPQCSMTKLVLNESGIFPEERNVDSGPAYLEEAKATGFKSMPILVHNGTVIASGFQPDKLEAFLEAQAEAQA